MANEGRLKMGLQLEEVEEMQDKAMWVLGGILEQNKDFSGRNHDIQTKPHLLVVYTNILVLIINHDPVRC